MWNETAWETLGNNLLNYLPRFMTGCGVLLAFWIGGWMVQRAIQTLAISRRLDADLIRFLGNCGKYACLGLGVVTALGTLGVDVTALVAGLGLTGFALGFALKDIVSNALSGMLVLIYKPFKSGDTILVAGMEGIVQEVNLRYTVLNKDGKRIFVPNATLFQNAVTVIDPQ